MRVKCAAPYVILFAWAVAPALAIIPHSGSEISWLVFANLHKYEL
jgi:hypothetical protein